MTSLDIEAGPVVLSKDGVYRYSLHRRWDESKGVVNFIMLNPSTADGNKLDATLRRVKGFCVSWGYGGFAITNLFAFRGRNPLSMRAAVDPVGPENDAYILQEAQQAHLIVCGWGIHGKYRGRDKVVLDMLKAHDLKPHYLVLVGDGTIPGHPLILSRELTAQPL